MSCRARPILLVSTTAAALPGANPQTITLSDKAQLGYVNKGQSYLLCGTNDGGSGKWFLYNSVNGGWQSSSVALSLDTCS
jgi:type IV pilus assembly protein PilA